MEGNADIRHWKSYVIKQRDWFIWWAASSRLSGYYGIDVNSANILTDAAGITSGFISSERLNGGYYDISVLQSAYSNNLVITSPVNFNIIIPCFPNPPLPSPPSP